jgi:integrase
MKFQKEFEKFQNLLKELFQFEASDLDFGIYRILNYKRDQIKDFIENRLPEIVESAFEKHKQALSKNIDEEFYKNNSLVKLFTLKRKVKSERVIPLKPQTLGLVALYVNQKGLSKGDKLFDITRQQAFNIVRKAVLEVFPEDTKRAHPHVLRHSFAIYALSSGVPITVVRSWLGHRNITSTLVYTQALAQDTRKFFELLEF